MKRIEINGDVTLIEQNDGWHSIIIVPMQSPFKDFLFTRDLEEAKVKALNNYNMYYNRRGLV